MAIGSEGVKWGLETLPLSLQEEPNAVTVLLEQARPLVGQENKGDALRRALEELRAEGYRQVMVFSQFTDTVEVLKQLQWPQATPA